MSIQVVGPRGQQNSDIVLNGHNIQMIKFLLGHLLSELWKSYSFTLIFDVKIMCHHLLSRVSVQTTICFFFFEPQRFCFLANYPSVDF